MALHSYWHHLHHMGRYLSLRHPEEEDDIHFQLPLAWEAFTCINVLAEGRVGYNTYRKLASPWKTAADASHK